MFPDYNRDILFLLIDLPFFRCDFYGIRDICFLFCSFSVFCTVCESFVSLSNRIFGKPVCYILSNGKFGLSSTAGNRTLFQICCFLYSKLFNPNDFGPLISEIMELTPFTGVCFRNTSRAPDYVSSLKTFCFQKKLLPFARSL